MQSPHRSPRALEPWTHLDPDQQLGSWQRSLAWFCLTHSGNNMKSDSFSGNEYAPNPVVLDFVMHESHGGSGGGGAH